MITITLTTLELRTMRAALVLATDYNNSLIDCHRIGFGKDGERTIPKQFAPFVRQIMKQTSAFKNLHEKVSLLEGKKGKVVE